MTLIQTLSSNEYQGRVEVHGKIFLGQFYTLGGESDADTVKIDLTYESVRFRKSENDEWQEKLQVLHDAYYLDNGRKKPVIRGNENFSFIRIRLQGIDSPELHYGAIADGVQLNSDQLSKFEAFKDIKYRQNWGARSSKELADFLTKYQYEENGKKYVKAYAFSMVDTPNNLFDKFGRAVCDIVISEPGINVNQWLVEKGWAFPDFYNSMSNPEIMVLKKKGDQAFNPPIGIRGSYLDNLVPFDFDLTFNRNDPLIDINHDKGDLNLPKFFRKQVDYEILRKCGVSSFSSLRNFIHFKKSECYKTEEYLEKRNQAKVYELSEFIGEDGYMSSNIGDLVYLESDAELVNKDGEPINDWY